MGGKIQGFLAKMSDEIIASYDYNALKLPASIRDIVIYHKKLEDHTNLDFVVRHGLTENGKVHDHTKPHILFVTEKWFNCDPKLGLTNSEHNLFGSLINCGLATFTRFHYDEYYHLHHHRNDAALIELCQTLKPDFLFFTWANDRYEPKIGTLRRIKQQLGIPIVALWFEAFNELVEAVSSFVEVNIVMHSHSMPKTTEAHRHILLWTPQDPSIYYNPNIDRDIDISFVGNVSTSVPHYAERRTGIATLREHGIDVYQAGGEREQFLSVEDYAGVHKRSKIALNFGMGGDGIPHSKGRIFEATLCGAMLLDSQSSETDLWFEPFVDYVPFVNDDDLVEKARYYLTHDAEREKIAKNGYQKAQHKYTAELFWRTVLEKVLSSKYPPS